MIHETAVQFPQEDVAGYASYLLSQWQSLLSSSLTMLDMRVGLGTSAAAIAPSASPLQATLPATCGQTLQSSPCQNGREWTAQHALADSAPKHSSAAHDVHTRPPSWHSVQQQMGQTQQAPEPQGFRPWSSSQQTAQEVPAPARTCVTQPAARHATPVSAQCTPAAHSATPHLPLDRAARVSGVAIQAAPGASLLPSAGKPCSYKATAAWQSPEPPQVLQGGLGFQPLHQLQGLPGLSPDCSVLQAFDSTFLRQMNFQGSPSMANLLQSPEIDQLVRYSHGWACMRQCLPTLQLILKLQFGMVCICSATENAL